MGGMGGMGGMGSGASLQNMQAQLRQNPEMMREMMQNPMVQSMMENMMNDPNGMMQQMSNNVRFELFYLFFDLSVAWVLRL